jgi:hypothetical protein
MPHARHRLVDVRGPRSAASVSSAVLAVVLLTGNVARLHLTVRRTFPARTA